MTGYKVTMWYTTSIDVFVKADGEMQVEDVVDAAKDHIDSMGDEAYANMLVGNLKTDPQTPYTIEKV